MLHTTALLARLAWRHHERRKRGDHFKMIGIVLLPAERQPTSAKIGVALRIEGHQKPLPRQLRQGHQVPVRSDPNSRDRAQAKACVAIDRRIQVSPQGKLVSIASSNIRRRPASLEHRLAANRAQRRHAALAPAAGLVPLRQAVSLSLIVARHRLRFSVSAFESGRSSGLVVGPVFVGSSLPDPTSPQLQRIRQMPENNTPARCMFIRTPCIQEPWSPRLKPRCFQCSKPRPSRRP